jgi:hypothetical protein
MRTWKTPIVLAAFLAAALSVSAQEAPKPMPHRVSRTETVTATITAINPATREITLKGKEGNSVTIKASDEVKRFNELKVGDEVTATYTESLAVRLAKPEEAAASAAADLKRSKGPHPGGAATTMVTAVVTLENVDPKVPSVTFKTASGEVRTVHVRRASNLHGYKAGDKVAITYKESLAIDVKPAEKK